MTETLRLAGVIKTSIINGSGIRYCIFLQGCEHACDGCQSPHTWNKNNGYNEKIKDILIDIWKNEKFIDGVTISGGEPLLQYDNLLVLLKALKLFNMNIFLWTGFEMKEIKERFPLVLDYVDTIIDGKYDKTKEPAKWRGSSNQRIWIRENNRWVIDDAS